MPSLTVQSVPQTGLQRRGPLFASVTHLARALLHDEVFAFPAAGQELSAFQATGQRIPEGSSYELVAKCVLQAQSIVGVTTQQLVAEQDATSQKQKADVAVGEAATLLSAGVTTDQSSIVLSPSTADSAPQTQGISSETAAAAAAAAAAHISQSTASKAFTDVKPESAQTAGSMPADDALQKKTSVWDFSRYFQTGTKAGTTAPVTHTGAGSPSTAAVPVADDVCTTKQGLSAQGFSTGPKAVVQVPNTGEP